MCGTSLRPLCSLGVRGGESDLELTRYPTRNMIDFLSSLGISLRQPDLF